MSRSLCGRCLSPLSVAGIAAYPSPRFSLIINPIWQGPYSEGHQIQRSRTGGQRNPGKCPKRSEVGQHGCRLGIQAKRRQPRLPTPGRLWHDDSQNRCSPLWARAPEGVFRSRFRFEIRTKVFLLPNFVFVLSSFACKNEFVLRT